MIYKHVGRRVNIFGSIPKSNFWCFFDVFLDLVILVYFNAISIDFYVYNWKNANIKDLNAWKIFMKFLCIYLGEGMGGGDALMHVYIWEHT